MTNWFRGIDEGSSTPGGNQVASPNHFFVDSINGIDDISGGTPSNPWKTIEYAVFQTRLINRPVLILADGYYPVFLSQPPAGLQWVGAIIGNSGMPVIASTNPNEFRVLSFSLGASSYMENITWYNCGLMGNLQSIGGFEGGDFSEIINNTFVIDPKPGNSGTANIETFRIRSNNSLSAIPRFKNCKWVCPVRIVIDSNKDILFENCNFHQGFRSESTLPYRLDIKNCDFGQGTTLEINDNLDFVNSLISHSNRVSQNNVDTPSNLINELNNINVDPQRIGGESLLQFYISENSPLVGNGENGENIGGYEIGDIIDLTNPSENNDIATVPIIQITEPATSGNIRPRFIQYTEPRLSPKVQFNGIVDFLENIPDNEFNSHTPKKISVEVTTRQSIGGTDEVRQFLYGSYMIIDDQGRGTADPNFDPFDISSSGNIIDRTKWDRAGSDNLITVAEWQPNFVLNDI